MIISLLVTGYVVYLYLKLKRERDALESNHFDSAAELMSATMELDARVGHLESYITALRKERDTSLC